MESYLSMSVLCDWVGDSTLGFFLSARFLLGVFSIVFSIKHKDKVNVKLQATGKIITKTWHPQA